MLKNQRWDTSGFKENPIFFSKKWGLIGLLHGPAFRLEVAGVYESQF
jgi:hypothetical protein